MRILEIRTICFLVIVLMFGSVTSTHAILAGDEFGLPADSPSNRLDTLDPSSFYNFVGALEISLGGSNYIGTGVTLSPNWVLTAGHNVDFDDNGVVDEGLSITYHLPGFGAHTATAQQTHPDFMGFGNPTVHNDLSLLYFADPLPLGLSFPVLGHSLEIGDTTTLVGFGRSGYGSYGYTSNATLTERRVGFNVIDSFEEDLATAGILFRYDFDDPLTTALPDGSLGNDLETMIGPGDSGGPLLVELDANLALVGINTFIEGYGGRFGDIGGGVVLDPYWDWIGETTGLVLIPEPDTIFLWFSLAASLLLILSRRNTTQ